MLYSTDDASFPLFHGWLAMKVASAVVIGLVIVGLLGRAGRAAATTFFAAVGGALAVSWLVRPVFVERYMVPMLPALFVAVALGLGQIRAVSRWAFAVLLTALLALEAIGVAGQAVDQPTEDWRGVARDVAAHLQANDRVIVAGAVPLSSDPTTAWSYYYEGSVPTVYYPTSGPIDPAALPLLKRLRKDGARVWYVFRRPPAGSPGGAQLEKELAETGTLVPYRGRLGLLAP